MIVFYILGAFFGIGEISLIVLHQDVRAMICCVLACLFLIIGSIQKDKKESNLQKWQAAQKRREEENL